jgi:DNA/RNA endonuclease G (NUC1)
MFVKKGLNFFAALLVLTISSGMVKSFGQENSSGQDIVKVRNTNYTSYFSKSQHIPVLVVYTLTNKMMECRRTKGESGIKFSADPQLAKSSNLKDDYNNSLFDQAQMMSPYENTCDRAAYMESFYYTNVMPMPKDLFKKQWETLQDMEMEMVEKYKKIKVFAGTVGKNWLIGSDNDIVVPEYCWKVIYIPSKDEYICYEFHNIEPYSKYDNVEKHKVDINAIESLAGVHFVNGIISASYVVPSTTTR